MSLIELQHTEIDDPNYTMIVGRFLSHYAEISGYPTVTAVHIDNYFSERWLGFAGTFRGIAGLRNVTLHNRLPKPPFRPSRVISASVFQYSGSASYTESAIKISTLHTEKNGGITSDIYWPGLYCWYSGNTKSNTTGSMMIYEVTYKGNNAWYIAFDKRGEWKFTKCKHVSPKECINIMHSIDMKSMMVS